MGGKLDEKTKKIAEKVRDEKGSEKKNQRKKR